MKHRVAPLLQALSEGPNIALDKPIILIGRHQECDIQIPSRKISRRHCCLAQVGDHLVVRDLGSTNGIRINGVKVPEGKVNPGDELMIGNIRYQLKMGDAAEKNGASMKNGIMAKKPEPFQPSSDLSRDVPVPLPDMSLSSAAPRSHPDPLDEHDDEPEEPFPKVPLPMHDNLDVMMPHDSH